MSIAELVGGALPVTVEKPWGIEEIWAATPSYVGKVLRIKAGEELSLQYHEEKTETIRVIEGEMGLLAGTAGIMAERTMGPGDSAHIPPLMHHRMSARTDCIVVEVSTPHLDDVVRLEDRYGRNLAEE